MAGWVMPPIQLKRVYDSPDVRDGTRVLVERLWPRGLTKEAARVDEWLKDVAPSHELRKWYGHEEQRWPEFRERYLAELRERPAAMQRLRALVDDGPVTFVYAARGERISAVVLREVLTGGAG